MKNVDVVIEKLNGKRFKKNQFYSSREISRIIGTTDSTMVSKGILNAALTIHPEWKKQYGRTWLYLGPQQPNLFNQPKVQPKPQVQTKPKRRQISLFWGLISIK